MKKSRIEFKDKRRIKSVDDSFDDAEEADLDRFPTFVEQLQQKADADDQRLKEYIAAHKEKMIEIDNVRKRLEGDVEKRAHERFGDLIKDILPLIDDIDRAIEEGSKLNNEDPLLEGVRILKEGLLKTLLSKGLEVISVENQPFDPELAQAVATEVVEDEKMDNVVVKQLAAGYKYEGRVLKHALVRVGRKSVAGNE